MRIKLDKQDFWRTRESFDLDVVVENIYESRVFMNETLRRAAK